MKNFNSQRVFARNQRQPDPEGDYVLYWMSINRRLSYNFALEYAVGWANKLGKPLLIYEGLSTNIPWASDRFHQFLMEGMAETQRECARLGISYYSYAEQQGGEGSGLVEQLAARACVVIPPPAGPFRCQQLRGRHRRWRNAGLGGRNGRRGIYPAAAWARADSYIMRMVPP
jgi:hypothetical protein